MFEGIKTWHEGVQAKRALKRTLYRLETRKAELAGAILEDRLKAQESWGRMSTDFEMGWNQAINSQLRAGGDEKTATSLQIILDKMIPESRRMFIHNPFAKSAIINLQNFCIGGDGYQYRKSGKNEDKVQEYWTEWMKRTGWRDMEMEVLKRAIRDGEVIIRWFGDAPRFIEPRQIIGVSEAPWGIITDPRDGVVLKFFIIAPTDPSTGLIDTLKAERVPADQIDFLKWPLVDLNCLRGMPPLYFVAANLEGAARCLKNMRELVAVQTAIAIVREHIEGASGTELETWVREDADKELDDPDTQKTVFQKKWASGLVVDVPHGEKLHFPAATMRADSYIEVVQADLRAVAASLGLPEFIFTANASSSNYASLMAAEGPAVKAFETLQGWLSRYFEKAFDRVILVGVKGGTRVMGPLGLKPAWPRLPARTIDLINSINPPTVRTRDFFAEARTRLIEAQSGVLAPQEWCAQQGRDYEEVMSDIDEHVKAHPQIPWPPTLAMQQGTADDLFGVITPAKGPDSNTTNGSQKRNAGKSGA